LEDPTLPRPDGELLTINQAAPVLGIATSTVHRWLNDGFIAGAQLTPAAPWRIRLTEDLRARFVDEEPQGYLTMYQAMRLLSVSRQTVLQRVSSLATSARVHPVSW
jgi:predicted DNA-binding transcriptional regulator AlpA